MVEGNIPFVNGGGNGIPAIEVGLNLRVSSNMAAVLSLVTINGVGLLAQGHLEREIRALAPDDQEPPAGIA
jgi:hypothetical protein